jgi:hypothetical protein
VWILGLLAIAPVVAAADKTIFDDDWVPPPPPPRKPLNPPPPSPVPAPSTRPVDVATKPSKAEGQPAEQPAAEPKKPAAPVRRAVPAKAEQAKSRKLFKEVYAKELADRSLAGRRALAAKLLFDASTVGDAPTDRFVLLVGAAEAGEEGADLVVCVKAADALAESYELDGLRFKADAAQKVTRRAETAEANAQNVRLAMQVADELVAADDYAGAAKVLAGQRLAVSGDPALTWQWQDRTRTVEAMRQVEPRVSAAIEKLKTTPNDPSANFVVGHFYCLTKGDWERGLPFLAAGSDATLAALAKLDLAAPKGAEERVKVGDGWWDYAAKSNGLVKSRVMARAGTWYARAEPDLSGLALTRIVSRLKEIEVAGAPASAAVELLPTMQLIGEAKAVGDAVALTSRSRLTTKLKFKPPVTFRLVLLSDTKDVRLAYGMDQLILNWEMNADELRLDGGPAGGRHQKGMGRLPANKWTTVELTVKPDEMVLTVDGADRLRTKADFSKVDEPFSLTGEVRVRSITQVPASAN